MQAAALWTAASRLLRMLAEATHRPPLAAISTTVRDCAYCWAAPSSAYGPERKTVESRSVLMPEFASQTSGSLAARARLSPAASRHPIGEGPL